MKRSAARILAALLLAGVTAACAPTARTPGTNATTAPGAAETRTVTLERPEEQSVHRVATAAWHRMQAGFLETGAYTTNVLVDLRVPTGIRWSLDGFAPDTYTLVVTGDDVPDLEWVVTPDGVTIRPATPTG